MRTRQFLTAALTAVVFAITLTAPASATASYGQPSYIMNSSDYAKFIEAAHTAGYTDQEIQQIEDYFQQPEAPLRRPTGNSAYNYVPNGCSDPRPWGAYKQVFLPACNTHDYCYSAQHNFRRSRLECDNTFYSSMRASCNYLYAPGSNRNVSCLNESNVYYWAVRTFGRKNYKGSGDPT